MIIAKAKGTGNVALSGSLFFVFTRMRDSYPENPSVIDEHFLSTSYLPSQSEPAKETIFVDTIQVRHVAPIPSASELGALGFFSSRKKGYVTAYFQNLPEGVKLNWSHDDASGGSWLSAEASLPKFYTGNNVQTLNERQIKAALNEFQAYICEKTGFDFDIQTANLSRLDAAVNFQCKSDSEVQTRLKAYQNAVLPRYDRNTVNDSTVTLKNKSREICIYSKLDESVKNKCAESVIDLSRGILRFESRLKTRRAVEQFGAKFQTANTVSEMLTPRLTEELLTYDIDRVGVNKPIQSRADLFPALVRAFGNKAHQYEGFLSAYDKYGDNFYLVGGISRTEYYRKISDLKKAGLWLLTDQTELEPLILTRRNQQ